MYAHTPMHTAEIWKKDIDLFYFLKSFLSLNRDKCFALYWCFCVRFPLSFYWTETGYRPWLRLLTKPTPILSRSICHNSYKLCWLVLCQHTQLSVAWALWRDCKLLYEGRWQTRDWALLEFGIWAQERNWYWWHLTEFGCLKGTPLALCL